MSRRGWAIVVTLGILLAPCAVSGKPDPTNTTDQRQHPGEGAYCEKGDTAGHGGTVYKCHHEPDGSWRWRKQ